MLSRVLNAASVLLVIFGMWSVLTGIMVLASPEWMLGMYGVTVMQVRAFSQDLLHSMMLINRFFGLCSLSAGLFVCVVSLIPHRKGEKWAWYTMLVVGGILMSTGLQALWISLDPAPIVFIALWVVGVALPAKEILGKPS